jgi:hypothetical protein
MATTIPVSTGKMKKKDNIAQLSPPVSQKPLVMRESYQLFSDRGNKFTAPVGTNQRSLNIVIGMFLSAPTHSIIFWQVVSRPAVCGGNGMNVFDCQGNLQLERHFLE